MPPAMICPRCNGDGDEPTSALVNVLTLGLWRLIDRSFPEKCRRCDGIGYIRPRRRPF